LKPDLFPRLTEKMGDSRKFVPWPVPGTMIDSAFLATPDQLITDATHLRKVHAVFAAGQVFGGFCCVFNSSTGPC
jgi:hypothetical protein